ncbi:MAG TPA: glycogen-binding domain-containing protein [Gemmatimonadaceae bacterium]|nr:glycogen-binding domain-containing protein [Gemmatimonadaceae bacterium]
MRRPIAAALSGLLVLIGMGRPLAAQHRSSLDVGVSVVRFLDESTTVAGPSMALTSAADGRRLFGQADIGGVGTFSGASGSATFVGGLRAPIARRWLLEGSGELFGVAGSSVRSAVAATGSGRVIRVLGDGGVWARGAAAASRREAGTLPARSVEAGAWWGWPRARLSVDLVDQRAKAQLFAGPFRTILVGTLPVHYQEGTLTARLEGEAIALDVSAGVRRDPDASRVYEPTFAVTASFWQSESRAFTLSVSQVPPDWVRGADAARWAAVGMRFYEPRPATARAARIPALISVGAGDEQRLVRVLAPGARRVELMADFTDWSVVPLTRASGSFERTMAVSPGTHRVLVRVDGGTWRPATNTPAVDDDLGGRAGLLVVP